MTGEEAIEELKKGVPQQWDWHRDRKAFKEAIEMGIKALEQEQKWIPVSEKLPKDGKWALFTDGSNMSVERYKKDAIDHFFPQERWFSFDEAIAWMPLPEPYKAESASEKEKLKAEVNGYFYGLNAAGKIDWLTYNTLYNVCMSILEKYYDRMKYDRMKKERRAESEKEMSNKRAATTEKDQKIGKWRYDGKTLICSICNTWFHITDRTTYMRRCPYCGAKMESEDKE